MKGQEHRILLYICSFSVPAALLLTVLALQGFITSGNKSMLIMDLSGQTLEFYNALKHGDVFFSWSKSLGTNYIGVFAYYVSSPFSLLTLFFSDEAMPLCILILTVLKVGFAGLSFTVYGTRRFGLKSVMMIIFSSSYALMSYNLAYSLCLMWLDGVIWLPILLFGVERIISDKHWGIFCLSLCIALISNYYISYMLILFSGIYFLARCFEERLRGNDFFKCMTIYVSGGFAAVGIGAFFLLPVFLSHFDGKLVDTAASYSSLYNFKWTEFFSKFFKGGYDSITNNGKPFVYCGFLMIVMAVLFFLLSEISWRNKLAGGALLIFLALSMWLSPVDRIWHVFQYPNWYPYRYSFLFSFVLISLACQAVGCLKLPLMRFAPFVIALMIFMDLGVNAYYIYEGLDGQFGYQDPYAYRQFRQDKSALLTNMKGFCRVRSTEDTDRTMNDALGFDYNGITHYSSAFSSSVNRWLKKYGFAQNYFWSSDYGSTPLTDVFFGIKYVISYAEPAPGYARIAESGGMGLYENHCFSSVAFFVPNGTVEPETEGSVFSNQNSLFHYLTGLESGLFYSVSTEGEFSEGYTRLSFVSDGRPVYCHFNRCYNTAGFYVNGLWYKNLFTDESDCIQYIGCFAEGTKITLELETNVFSEGYEICAFDSELFARGVQVMNRRSLGITDYSDSGRITGLVNCESDGVIVTSIPAASGWSAYVDGKKTPIGIAMDTFITVPLSVGDHEVKLIYTPPGLVLGSIISVIVILTLAVLQYRSRKKIRLVGNKKEERCI